MKDSEIDDKRVLSGNATVTAGGKKTTPKSTAVNRTNTSGEPQILQEPPVAGNTSRPTAVKTGDTNNWVLPIVGGVLALAVILFILLGQKKRKKK